MLLNQSGGKQRCLRLPQVLIIVFSHQILVVNKTLEKHMPCFVNITEKWSCYKPFPHLPVIVLNVSAILLEFSVSADRCQSAMKLKLQTEILHFHLQWKLR